ncbi:MAG: Ig-like domain-containing protein [Caulobacteraceae bacterium]
MAHIRIATLAISALALSALGSASALSQPAAQNQAGPYTNANPLPIPYADPNRDPTDAAQLFRFPGLSNKSGNPFCMPGSKDKSRPKVVATFPANGAVVRPGVVVVRVTFDQPMACDASFDGVSNLPNPCPGRWREATLSRDQRSFRTVCEAKPNTRYRMTLRSFRNSHGLAIPADVTFSTSGASPIATIRQALAEDTGGDPVAGG